MKRFSPKRLARNAEAQDFRAELVERVTLCEFCGEPARPDNPLVVHEVAMGNGHRHKAMDKPYAVLVLHWWRCHPAIHRMSRAQQLAILKHRRPDSYDIEAYYALIGRRFPDELDIEAAVNELISEEIHE